MDNGQLFEVGGQFIAGVCQEAERRLNDDASLGPSDAWSLRGWLTCIIERLERSGAWPQHGRPTGSRGSIRLL